MVGEGEGAGEVDKELYVRLEYGRVLLQCIERMNEHKADTGHKCVF